MDELALIEQHIKENKPEEFIRNCICCAESKFYEVCEKGYYHIAKWMIDHGADVHAHEDLALLCASENGLTEIVKPDHPKHEHLLQPLEAALLFRGVLFRKPQ